MTLHKFVYEYEGNTYLGERYPQRQFVIKSDCDDLDAHEILDLFKSYMVACGYAEKSFYDACTEAAQNNPYRKGGDRHELGETQWREEIPHPRYNDMLKNNIEAARSNVQQ